MLTGILKPFFQSKVKGGFLTLTAIVAGYDGFSSQFESFGLPKLGEVIGKSGSLMPIWGWLMIVQFALFYGLFEFVRQYVDQPTQAKESFEPDLYLRAFVSAIQSKMTRWSDTTDEEWKKQTHLKVVDTIVLKDLLLWGRVGNSPLQIISNDLLREATVDLDSCAIYLELRSGEDEYCYGDIRLSKAECRKFLEI